MRLAIWNCNWIKGQRKQNCEGIRQIGLAHKMYCCSIEIPPYYLHATGCLSLLMRDFILIRCLGFLGDKLSLVDKVSINRLWHLTQCVYHYMHKQRSECGCCFVGQHVCVDQGGWLKDVQISSCVYHHRLSCYQVTRWTWKNNPLGFKK